MKDIVDLIGRVLLSFIFLYDAYDTIFYFQDTKTEMMSYGLTWRPDLLLFGAIFLLILGGTLILIGYRSRFGAVLLLLYWIPITFFAYAFWTEPIGSVERRYDGLHFMKNIAIIGGLLMVFVNGSGRYSIRRLFATAKVPGA